MSAEGSLFCGPTASPTLQVNGVMHLRVRSPFKTRLCLREYSPPPHRGVRLLGGTKCHLQLRSLALQSPSYLMKDKGSRAVVCLLGFAVRVSSLLLLLLVAKTPPIVCLYDCPCCPKRPNTDEVSLVYFELD